jgi:outer membrane receptor protein involved in Fe transport
LRVVSLGAAVAMLVLGLWSTARAQPAVEIELPPIEVIGVTPLLGSGVDRSKVPAATRVLNGDDLMRSGLPSLLGALDSRVGGVALTDPAGNQLSPDLEFRGFRVSPLEGTAQGIAVYVNGARFNLPFGDTVNWDLIPNQAIDSANLEGANPVFGLNALGGSLSVQLKNGFTYQGGELTLSGGSFGRIQGDFQYGRKLGDFAAYVAASVVRDGGWRQSQFADLHQFFGDAGWRGTRGEVHVSLLAARNGLGEPGTVPVELLSVDRAAVFTGPEGVRNAFARATVTGSYEISSTTSLQAAAYYTSFRQKAINTNTPNFEPCSGFLCVETGGFLTDAAGNPIADFLNGGPYSEQSRETINTNGYGMALQTSNKDTLFGLPNQFVSGVSFDGGLTTFSGTSQAGGFSTANLFIGPGIVIDQADGSIAPVRVDITNAYYGFYATDIIDLTSRLSLNVSGRLNLAKINLRDQLGTALNGDHYYAHFNPGVGLTYRFSPALTAYASFSVANRAPTPAELSCASFANPCTLANFFVADPSLKQVVARTIEFGLRGELKPRDDTTLRWNLGFYRTDVNDDILFLPGALAGLDFFQNTSHTRRQGIEAGLTLRRGRLFAWIDYALTDATFQTSFTEDSPLNPAADANGQIQVKPGNRLPGVPLHRLKLGASYGLTDDWTIGFDAIVSSGQFLFGDEANLTPSTGGYVLLNLNTSYRVTPNVEIFGLVRNVFNARYETFGTFSDTGAVPLAQAPGATNPRSLSPAPPVAGYGGVRVKF